MSTEEVDMKIDAVRAKSLVEALHSVQGRVGKAGAGRNVSHVILVIIFFWRILRMGKDERC